MTEEELDRFEQLGCKRPMTPETQAIGNLVSEVRKLLHELKDPNYLYASTRIHRQAVISRDATIQRLEKEIMELKCPPA